MNLLFDLDGTLTDPGLGIARCLQDVIMEGGRTRCLLWAALFRPPAS